MNSYQKLKQENKRLRDANLALYSQIVELINNPNSVDSLLLKANYKFLKDIQNQLFFGDATKLIT